MITHGDSKPNSARQTTWEGIEQAFRNTIYTADTFNTTTDFKCECTACYCGDCPLKDKCGEHFAVEQWRRIRDEVMKDADCKE